jgi:hypothetical protein
LPAPAEAAPGAPRRLGGYEILKSLGQGGMGAVYLARQVSLNREVALKVMHPNVARNPTFLARFLREALAAAKLVHPHVVQIYDVGQDHGVRFYSMELIRGSSLGQILKKKGRIEVVPATRYILQVARGLLFAHNRGIVHRDIKPDNLLLDELGIIKIADLGLVKMPVDPASGGPASVNLTAPGMTVGTAAYMAPEQARACVDVDHRADIYALGCTFYALLAGRPPFSGSSSLEIMTRHCTDPLPPLEGSVPNVPPTISAIISRMLAKNPDDRYPDCKQLIADLRRFLDRDSGKDALPTAEHTARLQACVRQFQTPMARLRGKVMLGSLAVLAAAVLATLALHRPMWSMAILFVAVTAGVARLLLNGFVYRTPQFVKLRELIVESERGDWIFWGVGGLIVLILVIVTGAGPAVAGLIVLGVTVAVTVHCGFDRKVAAERRPVVEDASRLLEHLRKEGMDEEPLQHFVYDHGGDGWEDFFEALFGYDWMVRARQEWGRVEGVARRPRHAPWRDPVIRWFASLRQARQLARERKMLASLAPSPEASAPEVPAAPSMPLPAAPPTAITATPPAPSVPGPAVEHRPEPVTATFRLLAGPVRKPTPRARRRRRPPAWWQQAGETLRAIFGPRVRGLAGLLLVTGCVLWIHQNNLVSEEDLADPTHFAGFDTSHAQPLHLSFLPDAWLRPFHSLNPGIAGLVLLLSLFWRSWRLNIFLIPAAVAILLGDSLGLPDKSIGGTFGVSITSLFFGTALLTLGFLNDWLGAPRELSRDEM